MRTIAITLAALGLSACGLGTGEDGWHRGYVTDVSTAGWFCKTQEGQIMSGNGNSALHYEFTITNSEAYRKLLEAQASNREVNLHYHSPRFFWWCSSSHSNFVDEVTTIP